MNNIPIGLSNLIFYLCISIFFILNANACSNPGNENTPPQATSTTPEVAQANVVQSSDPNILIDPRDNQSYKIIQLYDGNMWMAENLNYKSANSWVYGNDEKNAPKYGRLYSWESAKAACPNGWRLPNDKEWAYLTFNYGGSFNKWPGQHVNTSSDAGQKAYASLIDGGDSSFSAKHGGYRNADGSFEELAFSGYYWTSSEESNNGGWYYYFINSKPEKIIRNYWDKRWGYSCRCIKDK